jgi:hypothetical protein
LLTLKLIDCFEIPRMIEAFIIYNQIVVQNKSSRLE